MDPSIGGGCGTCGCVVGVRPPPCGGGSQSEARSGVGIAARTGKVQSQREPGRVLTGSSRGAPGFSPSSRKTVEHATADQRPRLARAPPACFPSQSPPRAKEWGTGAGTVLDVPPTNPIKPPLRRRCTTQHRATSLPGMHGCRSGPLWPAILALAKAEIRTIKEPSAKRCTSSPAWWNFCSRRNPALFCTECVPGCLIPKVHILYKHRILEVA